MLHPFSRTELLIGRTALEKLSKARVAIFGLGGVGGYAVEALARCGVGHLDLIDHDTISLTNINRQILALCDTVGQYKAVVAAERVRQINPEAVVTAHTVFYTPETQDQFDFKQYDYIIDAIDTVTGKLALAVNAKSAGTPIISSMGTGNKLDPTAFEVADISKTSVCPLARIMRKELRHRGIEHLKVVYSKEDPLTPAEALQEEAVGRRQLPGSVSFVPSVAGLIIAGEVIKDLIK
ncbi:MAG: tRNA threonylcarbamoyladenosine dehydratase [Ruminococcaceae bacterium]|nr:tRNA threonylcarbamoyladenosine dehydratase [Oscillospiraceae bacterium]